MENTSGSVEEKLRRVKAVGLVLAGLAAMLAVSVLYGYAVHDRRFISFGTHATTKPSIATAFLILAVATILLLIGRRKLSGGLSALVLVFGAIGVLQRIFEFRTGLENLPFDDFDAPRRGEMPGRPAIETVLSVLLLSVTLLLASLRRHRPAARMGYLTHLLAIVGATEQLNNAHDLLPTPFVGHIGFPSVIIVTLIAVAAQCALARHAGWVHDAFVLDSITAQLRRTVIIPIVSIVGGVTLALVVLVQSVEPSTALVVGRVAAIILTLSFITVWFVVRRFGERLSTRTGDLTEAAVGARLGSYEWSPAPQPADEVGALATEVDRMLLALSERRRVEGMVAATQRAAGEQLDVGGAIAVLSDALAEAIPHERISFFQVEEDGLRMAAVHGSAADKAPVGTRLTFGADRVAAFKQGLEPQLVPVVPPGTPDLLPDVRSYIIVPVVVAGEVQAAVSFMSSTPGTYGEPERALAVQMVGAVSGTLQHLYLLGLEVEARQSLDRLNRMRAEFVAVVAHDLRSPMSVIANMADMLQRDWSAMNDEKKLDYLAKVSRRTRSLSRFVEDALNVAKIDSGEIRFVSEPVDMRTLIDRVVGDFRLLWPLRSFEVDLPDGDVTAMADERQQWRVLNNLLANACAYSPADSPVRISVGVTDGMVRVAVADQGNGVPPEMRNDIFEKFTRAENTSNQGSGLGLYICRRLVEAQGGHIDLVESSEVGSVFEFTVPATTKVESR